MILEVIESHCSLLSRGIAPSDLCFRKIDLAAMWRIDWKGRVLEAGRPIRRLKGEPKRDWTRLEIM